MCAVMPHMHVDMPHFCAATTHMYTATPTCIHPSPPRFRDRPAEGTGRMTTRLALRLLRPHLPALAHAL